MTMAVALTTPQRRYVSSDTCIYMHVVGFKPLDFWAHRSNLFRSTSVSALALH